MAYTLIDTSPIQIQKNAAGNSASGYYLKLYAAGTTTPISMYTTSVGGGALSACQIDSDGFTINGSGDPFIPYVDQSYKMVVYPTLQLANSNSFASAFLVIDNITQVAASPGYADKPYDMTLAEFKASTVLVAGDVVTISDRASATFDIASGVSGANTFDVIANTAGTLKATLRINGPVDVKALGAVGDKVADDTLPIQHAFTLDRSVYFPRGNYRMTDDLDPRALGWDTSGQKIYGDGIAETSLWFYSGVSGIFSDCEGMVVSDMSIYNGVFMDAFTGTAATDRLNITASTYGIKLGRSHMSINNVEIRGFDYGIYARSRYYVGTSGVRTLYNNYSFYADAADATPAQYEHFYSCEFTAGYKANIYITRGQGWVFSDCSFEGCTDYDADGVNYPFGGVYVASGATAVFDNCWVEGANIFLDGSCTLDAGNWRNTACRAPQDVRRVLEEVPSLNLVDPIWYPAPSWPDSTATQSITKAITQLNSSKRYVIVSNTAGAGSSKQIYSDYSDIVRGIEYTPSTLDGWHYAGIWVQFKTADITMFDLQVEITDSNGTVYEADTHSALYPAAYPSLTTIDTWQYVGYLAPIKSSNITAYPITRTRLRIRYGLSAADYSGSARVMWLADPVLKFFKTDGHAMHNVDKRQRVSVLNVSNPPTDAELDAAFGTPAQVGKDFNILIDDNNADGNVYMVRSNGTSWWYTTLTKAV